MNVMSKQKSRPAVSALSPVQAGLSPAGLFQLIERAREVYNDLDEQHLKIPKEERLQIQHNLARQGLVWDYQNALAQVAAYLRPCNMNDVLAMLKLMDDRLDDLVVNDHEENGIDVKAELSSLRRMLRGCLPIVAAELGAELDENLQSLCESEFAEVPK